MPLVALPARGSDTAGEVYTALGAPVLREGEVVELAVTGVLLVVQESECGNGALFVTTQRTVWVAEARERPGAEVDFPSLLMHSVSSNGSADPAAGRPAIFCQVEADPAWSFKLGECSESGSTAASAASAADEPGPDPDVGMPEVVTMLLIPVPGAAVLSSLGTRSAFVPLDEEDAGSSAAGGGPTSMLDLVYQALSTCSEMNPPDEEDVDGDAGDAVTTVSEPFASLAGLPGGAGWITSPEQAAELDAAQMAALVSLEAKFDCDDEDVEME